MKKIKSTLGNIFLVDDDDYPLLSRWNWSEVNGYAYCKISEKSIYMHKLIMGKPGKSNFDIDHINRNKNDNRKENLRFCSHRFNLMNSKTPKNNRSGFKGVRFDKNRNKWIVEIGGVFLGRFKDIESAICCRVNAATQIYGEKIYHGEI